MGMVFDDRACSNDTSRVVDERSHFVGNGSQRTVTLHLVIEARGESLALNDGSIGGEQCTPTIIPVWRTHNARDIVGVSVARTYRRSDVQLCASAYLGSSSSMPSNLLCFHHTTDAPVRRHLLLKRQSCHSVKEPRVLTWSAR